MLTSRCIAFGFALCAAALLVGCGSEPEPIALINANKAAAARADEGAKPQVASAVLSSDEPGPGETLSVRYEAKDATGQDLDASFLWQLNGLTLPEDGPEIQVPLEARRGDTIKVRVLAQQGKRTSEPVWVSARIGNSPEEWVDLRLEPSGEVAPGTSLTAVSEVKDHDQDPIEYEYDWKLSGQPHRNKSAYFSTAGLQRGDTIMVQVTASDGETFGSERLSNVVTIANSDPTIISAPPEFSADASIKYEVRAKDHDGDRRFIYSLDAAPKTMEMDRVTGVMKWKPTEKDIGRHMIEVRVDDRHGGFALQHFELTVGQKPVAIVKHSSPASGD